LTQPDVFTALALGLDTMLWSLEHFDNLLAASLRFTLKDQMSQQSVVLLLRSNCTSLVPRVHRVAPAIGQMFLSSRNMETLIMDRMEYYGEDNSLPTMMSLRRLHPLIAEFFYGSAMLWSRMISAIEVKDIFEWAVASVVASGLVYEQLAQRYFNSPMAVIYEEELDNDLIRAILLDRCAIREIHIQSTTSTTIEAQLKGSRQRIATMTESDRSRLTESDRIPLTESDRIRLTESDRIRLTMTESDRIRLTESDRIPLAESDRIPLTMTESDRIRLKQILQMIEYPVHMLMWPQEG